MSTTYRTKARALSVYERHLRRRGLSERTVGTYLAVARGFLGWLKKPLRLVVEPDVRAYLAVRSKLLSAPSLAAETSRLRRFFAALVAEGLLSESPAEDVGRAGRVPRPAQVLLGPAAVERLLAAASRPTRPWGRVGALRDRAVVELAYALGLRAAELRAALLIDLDLLGATLLARRAKRGGVQALPIPPATVEHLRAYLAESRPVLAARGRDQGRLLLDNRGGPITGARLQELFCRVARRAGLRAHAHALRRAVATHLVQEGASVVAVQQLLGHARLDTTAAYVEVDRDDLRRAVEILER